jgi:hypothetical protein
MSHAGLVPEKAPPHMTVEIGYRDNHYTDACLTYGGGSVPVQGTARRRACSASCPHCASTTPPRPTPSSPRWHASSS